MYTKKRVRLRKSRKHTKRTVAPHISKRQAEKILSVAAEKKHKDANAVIQSIDYFGSVNSALNQIARGTSDNGERVGDSIRIKSIQLNWIPIAADSTNVLRFIVFQWYDVLVTPTAGDILINVGTVNAPNSLYNWDNKLRYRILYDKRVSLGTTAGNGNGCYKKLITRGFRRDIRYNGAAATDFINNAIYTLVISDSAAVAHPTVSWTLRMNYTDA